MTNKAKRPKSTKTRSRFGCLSCKARHIKCDESRPKCNNCIKKKIECSYDIRLQFKEDFQSKNKCFGREGVWSKNKKINENIKKLSISNKDQFFLKLENPIKFINFENKDFEELTIETNNNGQEDDELNELNNIYLSILKSFNPNGFANSQFFFNNSNLSFALSFYVENISPIFNPINIDHLNLYQNKNNQLGFNFNSYPKFILHNGLDMRDVIKYSEKYNHVLSFILSLSSIYLSKSSNLSTDQKIYWENESKKLKNNGLKLLLINIKTSFENNLNNSKIRVDLLLSFLLITLYDLANGCNDNWSSQLKSCQFFLNQSYEGLNITDTVEISLFSYIIEFFAYQESMGRTACNKKNIFNKDFWYQTENQKNIELLELSDISEGTIAVNNNLIIDDDFNNNFNDINDYVEQEIVLIPWMGCDKRLIGIITDITDSSFEKNKVNFEESLKNIEKKLKMVKFKNFEINNYLIKNTDNKFTLINNEYSIEEFCFLLTCEIKRICTIIYYECCLNNKYPSHPIIKNLINKVYEYIEFIIIDNNYRWCSLIWSIYIISTQLDLHDENCEVKKMNCLKFFELLKSQSLGNIGKVIKTVKEIWKKRLLFNFEIKLNGLENGKKNDWETFVVDKNLNISLA